MKHRFLSLTIPSLLAFTAIAGSFLVPVESHAKRLSTRDLRQSGFAGGYRGVVGGGGGIFNLGTGFFDTYGINTTLSERIPPRKRVSVAGPTNASRFSLTVQTVSGNDRRVRVLSRYSGVSFDTFFGANMVGSGSKILTITKRGEGRRARFTMRYINNLNVNRQAGNVLRQYWRIAGTLRK